jgi:glucosylceramidase
MISVAALIHKGWILTMDLKLVTTTTRDHLSQTQISSVAFIPDEGIEHCVVNLHPSIRNQTFEGFGGALTEASAYVFAQMDESSRQKLLAAYFSPSEMNYQHVRISIDSCDFSLGHYEAMSDPEDIEFKSFNLDRVEQYIIPLLDVAQKTAGKDLAIMLSPWSPPAFMKTNGERNHGGSLRAEYRTMWAEYICRYIAAFRNKGYQVSRISIQNEPKARQTWDSCVYTADQEREFLEDHMYPALVRNGMDTIEVFIWDHNKERVLERAQAIIGENKNSPVAGIAFHWYSGDHFEELELFHQCYPDKRLISSESCVEYSKYGKEEISINAERLAHDMIGNLNHGMHAFYDWNILLDGKGGPNHVGNFCEAPFMYDLENKNLIEQVSRIYYSHFCKMIKPGARRIGFSKYTDRLEMTAFQNPDNTLTGVFLNRTDSALPVNLRIEGHLAAVVIEPRSIASFVIEN